MRPVLRADDVRAHDLAAERAGTPVATLMERAGHAVAKAARDRLGGAYGRRIVVIAGAGNNAGDGFVAAEKLARWGARVDVVVVAGDAFAGPALQARSRWTRALGSVDDLPALLRAADLVIDAIFGVGLSREVGGDAAKAIDAVEHAGTPVVSVDIPSGIDADTGRVRGTAVRADLTVTFEALKPGLVFAPGREHAGDIVVAPLGGPTPVTAIKQLEAADVAARWPFRAPGGHKRDAGTLLVVAGSAAMPGAAILTCRAAVRSGAGLVTLAAPDRISAAVATQVPEITTIPVPGDRFADAGVSAVLDAGRFDALAIGPGLGRHPETRAAVGRLLSSLPVPAVVDADALQGLAEVARPEVTVVTPHAGEWATIVNGSAAEAGSDRIAAVQRLLTVLGAGMTNLVAVLKGPGTLIASKSETFLDTAGGPELAQGGTGDALTGILGALLAAHARRGTLDEPAALAAAGVWVHGNAARIAARGGQPSGSTRLIEAIPDAVAQPEEVR